jgi:hypothetical protein
MKTCVPLWYLVEFFLEWEMFEANILQKIRTHILCSIIVFRKSCRLWDSMDKYGRAMQAQVITYLCEEKMCVVCQLTKARIQAHTLIIFNTYSFTATVVMRTRLSVTLYVHCLSCTLRAGRSRDRIPVGARFSAPVQAGPGVYPASRTMGTGSFPGKAAGAWRWPPTPI